MDTSKTSEEIQTGVIGFRPNSLTPVIRVVKGDDIKLVPIMVEDYDKARAMEGQEVRFTVLMNPYGPHIVSDHGFAMIL
jgi:hypothetical protein